MSAMFNFWSFIGPGETDIVSPVIAPGVAGRVPMETALELGRSDLRLRRLTEYLWLVRDVWNFRPRVYPAAFLAARRVSDRSNPRPEGGYVEQNTKDPALPRKAKSRPPQDEYDRRNREIYLERWKGKRFWEIGNIHGLSPSRIRQICLSQARRERIKARRYTRSHLARPIDLGGPRDVWLTFYPGDDTPTFGG